jgi:hypothetical protein
MKKTFILSLFILLLFSMVFANSLYQSAVKILDSKHISELDKTISYYYLFKNRSIGLTHAEPGMMYKENYRLLISMDLHLTNNPDKDLPYLIAYAYHSEPYNYVNRNPSASESLLAFRPYYDYRLKTLPKIFDSYVLNKLKDPNYKWPYTSFSSYISYLNSLIVAYRNNGKSPESNLELIKDKLKKSGRDYITEVDKVSVGVYSQLEKRRKFDWLSFFLMISILAFVFDFFLEKKYNLIFALILAFLLVISLFTGTLDNFNTFNAISGFTMVFLLLISLIVWLNSSKKRWIWFVSLLFLLVFIFSFIGVDFNTLKIDDQSYFLNSPYYNLYKEHLTGKYSTIDDKIAFLKAIESKEQNDLRSLIYKSVAGVTRDFTRMGAIKEVKVFHNNIRLIYNRPMKGIEPDKYPLYTRLISNTGKFYTEFLKKSATRHAMIKDFEGSFLYKIQRAGRYINPELKSELKTHLQQELNTNDYERYIYKNSVEKVIDSSKEHGMDFMPIQLRSGMTFLVVMSWLFISTLLFKRNKFIPFVFAVAALIVTIFIIKGFSTATLFEQYDFSLFSFNWISFISHYWLWYVGAIYSIIIIIITFLKGVHL